MHPGGEEGGARRRGRSGGQREIQVRGGGERLLEECVCVVDQSDQSSRVVLSQPISAVGVVLPTFYLVNLDRIVDWCHNRAYTEVLAKL